MRFALVTTLLASFLVSISAHAVSPDKNYLKKTLTDAGFSKPFVKEMLDSYERRKFEDVLRLNVLLYLRKADYHGPQVTDEAVRYVRKFMADHKETLAKTEKLHQVPAEVVASLLFIESRFGKSIGRFHIPSVFLHLLHAPRKEIQDYLLTQTDRYTDQKITDEDRKTILARTEKKAAWALEELKALEKIYSWKWELGSQFRGSFSGAMGMPQFLPSSYMKWSRSLVNDKQPDLKTPEDSITSVAYYLKDHGWKKEEGAQIDALMKYNNSRDYAKAILALAKKVDAQK